MFASEEEAEKAARLIGRLCPGVAVHARWPERRVWVWDRGLSDGTTLGNWEDIADFLLERRPEPGPPEPDRLAVTIHSPDARKVKEANVYIKTAREILEYGGNQGQAIVALTHAIEKLLEAL
jgi:hypothetical protein